MNDLPKLLMRLAAAPGVSGCEDSICNIAKEWLTPFGICETTVLGSLICRAKTASPQKPHLLLTAHMDQIGLIVTYIDDKGFLRVGAVGGIDRSVLLAAQVQVYTKDGILPGVICTVPPHLSTDDSTLPKIEDLAIDIGFSCEEAKKRVLPGDRILCLSIPKKLQHNVCAQALDNRAGCAAVLWAARALGESLDCSLSVLLSSMEEVGEQGAATGAKFLMPTHALIVDVSFAHTPDARRSQCGELGSGVMIGTAAILDNNIFQKLQEIAIEQEIPFQIEAMGGTTGTDADSIAIAGNGVRCGLLSIPLKYMHTPVEIVNPDDVEAVSNLICAWAREEFGGSL